MNDNGALPIVSLVLIVVIVFALIFVSVYVNAQIDTALTDTFADNTASGGVYDVAYFKNHTAATTTHGWQNITFPGGLTAGELAGTTSNFTIWSGNMSAHINASVNGANITGMQNVVITAKSGLAKTITQMIAATNLTGAETVLRFNWTVNSTDTRIELVNVSMYAYTTSYYLDSDWRTHAGNKTVLSAGNVSDNWNTNLDIVQVTIIITILAAAIGAIFMFTRYRS